MTYRVFGLTLSSDVPIPELRREAAGPAEPDVRFRVRQRGEAPPEVDRWFMIWTLPTGEPWMTAARIAEGYLIRFPLRADFVVGARGGEITCLPGADTPPETVRHLLLDHVLPPVLNLRGIEALHASAVATAAGVVAFTGPSGVGKSTLAAGFHGTGCEVWSDDCLPLRERGGVFRAVPAYAGLRLWNDSADHLFAGEHELRRVADYSDKRRIDLHGTDHPARELRLRRIYALTGATAELREPELRPLTPRDAMVELIRRSFRFVVDDRDMLERQMGLFSRLSERVPVVELAVPGGLQTLPGVVEAIRADLAATPVEAAAG